MSGGTVSTTLASTVIVHVLKVTRFIQCTCIIYDLHVTHIYSTHVGTWEPTYIIL